MFKAIAFDMDGTLLSKNRQILPETVSVLETLISKGIKIILVSGRHHSLIYPYYHQLNLSTPQICCNGTYLFDFKHNKAINSNPINKTDAHTLLDMVYVFDVHTLIYNESFIYYEVLDEHLKGIFNWVNSLPKEIQPEIKKADSFSQLIDESNMIFKFATSCDDIGRLKQFSQKVESTDIFECEWSWINRADVAMKGNTKGNGLKNWAKDQNIEVDEIIAFGDHYNDISMLKIAGLGIAMGNADDEIKKIADKTIGHHDTTAIADTLTEIFGI